MPSARWRSPILRFMPMWFSRGASLSPAIPSTSFVNPMSRTSLLEPIGDLVRSSFGANFVLVAARCATDTDRANDLISRFEHHATGDQKHPGKMLDRTERLPPANPRDDRAGRVVTEGRAQRNRAVSLATAGVDRVRRCAVALGDSFDDARGIDHRGGDLVA